MELWGNCKQTYVSWTVADLLDKERTCVVASNHTAFVLAQQEKEVKALEISNLSDIR